MQKPDYRFGADVGSTTVKLAVLASDGSTLYTSYRRHFAHIRETLLTMLDEFLTRFGDGSCAVAITGSGGLSLAKGLSCDFVQEVVAETAALRDFAPETDVAIELGGEDAKIIYFKGGIDQRMNGICAGGTGSFIDQMASLLQTDAEGLNNLAKSHKEIYPIAARCGVFAKSDLQPLMNDGAAREDLAASIFQAVVNQTISGLACGRKIRGKVAFLGGPLYFLSELRQSFIRTLELSPDCVVFPAAAHLFPAIGCAMRASGESTVSSLRETLSSMPDGGIESARLEPLFPSREDYAAFSVRQSLHRVKKHPIWDYDGNCYLGIDAGSTTTKMALISEDGELLFSYYRSNKGDPIAVCKDAFRDLFSSLSPRARIARCCSTGYGEALVKEAFCLDDGEVETISHFRAARFFDPDVNSILDIGGQDMKCIRIKDGCVDSITLNEACSSGCGSFLENFAASLGYSAQEFASLALFAPSPVDLGTRCTVFMNSNVKQAQKEGASVSDIAAGLAYSVIKNALFKVIRLADASALGSHIVVQGGTFYNDAVLRAFEKITGCEAIRPDISGIMGAFGAALIARENDDGQPSRMLNAEEIERLTYTSSVAHCGLCQNKCRLTVNTFDGGRRFITGNRCEKGLGGTRKKSDAPNLFDWKLRRLFAYEPLPEADARHGTVGIPRVLNLFEMYPFWAVFFREIGVRAVPSPLSTRGIYAMGMDSIPSESECYPAKLAHGHIEWLVKNGYRRIFYPCVSYERKERPEAQNQFNCPMVISYPENLKLNLDSLSGGQVEFLDPFLSFEDESTVTKRLASIIPPLFGAEESEVVRACRAAWRELAAVQAETRREGEHAIAWVREHGSHGIVLAGRPYHLDPEINHGIPEMVQSYGYAVLTEDSVMHLSPRIENLRVTDQWTYHARLYAAADAVCRTPDLDLIQLNSFGCGLDAVTSDQVSELLARVGKPYTLLKIDEVTNLGAARIRVRSLISAIRMRAGEVKPTDMPPLPPRVVYTREMQREGYTILCTKMTAYHFEFIREAFRAGGYNMVLLENEGRGVIDAGVKYVNNDACYPALIVTGQVMDAVLSGAYDTNRLAIAMSQTGGGCRASNYVGFIRRALASAGYGHIPVISINVNGMEKNPGMHLTPRVLIGAFKGINYGDLLMRVLLRVRPYEMTPGSANALFEKWKAVCIEDVRKSGFRLARYRQIVRGIVREFDEFPIREDIVKPKVGVVGEILVKYMPIANNHIVDALESEGMEVVMPDLMGFLLYCAENQRFKHQQLGKSAASYLGGKAAVAFLEKARAPYAEELAKSRRFSRPETISRIELFANEILQSGNACGEGWYLTGEMIGLIESGVGNILCTQPFGCLPNHIVGKGVLKRLRELHPGANIVAVDYDPGASQVNQLNRIKLMLENAKDALEE